MKMFQKNRMILCFAAILYGCHPTSTPFVPFNTEGQCFSQPPKTVEIPKDIGQVDDVAFSYDGKVMAARAAEHVVLWNTETASKIRVIKRECNECSDCFVGSLGIRVVVKLKFHPNTYTIFILNNNKIEQLNIESGEIIRTYQTGDNKCLLTFDILSDGKRVVGASQNDLLVWDVETGQRLKRIDIRGGDVGRYSSLAVSSNQKWIALSGYGTFIWNADNYEFEKHLLMSGMLQFSPDSSMLAGSEGGVYQTSDWSLVQGKTSHVIAWLSDITLISADGGAEPQRIEFWDVRTRKQIHTIAPTMALRFPITLVVSPGGKYLAALDLLSRLWISLWECTQKSSVTKNP